MKRYDLFKEPGKWFAQTALVYAAAAVTGGFAFLIVALILAACGGNTPPAPSAGWTCFKCSGMTLNGDGSFTFPNSGGAVGYIYTAKMPKQGQTVALNFSLTGNGTVVPSPASGSGPPELRLFLWENGDDVSCSGQFASYRWWSNPGAASLVSPSNNNLAVVIDPAEWTNCIGQHDFPGFVGTLNNLLGVGFTFGSQFFGHGVYANGDVSFKINSFKVQ
jgi:hypothetical protein